jgi:hypothetical protein
MGINRKQTRQDILNVANAGFKAEGKKVKELKEKSGVVHGRLDKKSRAPKLN